MIRARATVLALIYMLVPATTWAADQWIEVKSANFAVVSNASDGLTRRLVWQLEQLRGAMVVLWPWAKPDLNKPLTVIAVKDETSMRALAPQYWEQRGGMRPASVWVTGPDQHYLVVRADVEIDSQGTNNPFITAYFAYIGLILDQSLDRDLPFWFRRGFTGVLSNTLVRDDRIVIGAPIPWELEILRERPRLRLADVLQIRNDSPQLKQAGFLETFDAQVWALVHFLMFSNEGKRSPMLDSFVKMVAAGNDAKAAFTEAFGAVDAVEGAFLSYIQQRIFLVRQVKIDVAVQRERFPIRKLSPVESASTRALLHAAMRRPVESRAAIAEARKAEPNAAETYAAEGLLFDADGKESEARTAFAKAAELETANAYVYYRLASLSWQPMPSQEVLDRIDALLLKAVSKNTRYARAYAWLGQLRAERGSDVGIGFVRRAILLEPREFSHRLQAGYAYLALSQANEARTEAQNALVLADEEQGTKAAQTLLERISKAPPAPPR